jgi:hypothetical protein
MNPFRRNPNASTTRLSHLPTTKHALKTRRVSVAFVAAGNGVNQP